MKDTDFTLWNVKLDGEIIDTVTYPTNTSKNEVRCDLLCKGYDPSIKLEKAKW